MQAKITKSLVDKAKSDTRDQFIWDTDIKGFGLKVTPKGRRVYVVQKRLRGRLRRFTIGPHGAPWTPDKARIRAAKILGAIASGEEPPAENSSGAADLTVSGLADLYVSEGSHTKKSSTRYNDRGVIERHIKPLIGKRHISDLTRGDIERMMAGVAAGKTALDEKSGFRGRSIVRGGQIAANNAVALVSSILSFAMARNLIKDNPAIGINKYRPKARERFLSEQELRRLGEVLDDTLRQGTNPYAVAAIRLLLLTGCRRNEILSLCWDWVDYDRGMLKLPDSKSGAKIVPLGTPAISLLRSIPRKSGNPFVFPSTRGDGHLVGLQKIWEKLRARADLADVRLHDLRHTYASMGAASGESLYIVGKLVGHKQQATTQRYAHLADSPLRDAADRIGARISEAMQPMKSDQTHKQA